MIRIFAAIKIHPDEALMNIYMGLKNACKYDRINWVDPENIHITLKFFGETEESRIPEINQRLFEIASEYQPFELKLEGAGVFGSFYKPRVLWVGIKENEMLHKLGQEVLDKMDAIGFKKDRQNFIPHLTLGRIKYTDNKQRFFDLVGKYEDEHIKSELVDQFYLLESKLSSSGPEYTVLDTFDLIEKKPIFLI